jgi:hypothetical protein
MMRKKKGEDQSVKVALMPFVLWNSDGNFIYLLYSLNIILS